MCIITDLLTFGSSMVSAWEVFSIFQQRFLLFILKESPIFFSCETCFRGALLIKSKNSNDKFENNSNEQKIWGTINIVDALIYSCANLYGFSNKLNENISKNNIIYYLNEKANESFEMIDSLRNKNLVHLF